MDTRYLVVGDKVCLEERNISATVERLTPKRALLSNGKYLQKNPLVVSPDGTRFLYPEFGNNDNNWKLII